jgi:quercetin dioxygenase-like cupin family protein
MKAYKLINTDLTHSGFQEGSMPELEQIDADYFFMKTNAEDLAWHPAPRYQFVITLKGKLKFTVSDGSSFIIEPGVILVAKDLYGEGHKWEIIDGNEWHRIYIVPSADADDHFKPNLSSAQ